MTALLEARRRRQGGQILVLFTFALVAMLAMLALVFDGAGAVTLRRQMQNAGDAGALAAVNTIQTLTPRTCSATSGPPPGAPQTAVLTAARAAVRQTIPSLSDAQIAVTCPTGWDNFAVQVALTAPSRTYFGGAIGLTAIQVSTSSQAVNGVITSSLYSIVMLDPYNAGYPNGRRGCPSVLISGGPSITLEGSMAIDSACPAASGGALGTNGNSATLTFTNSSKIVMMGDFVPGPLTISPTPLTQQPYIKDPLLGISPMPTIATVSASKMTLSGSTTILQPGTYVGGIQMKNSAKAYLMPGIYVMKGGGFDLGAQNAVYSLPSGATTTSDSTWAADCPVATCGVLIYNTAGTGNGAGAAMGQLTVGAGATLKLRPYAPNADLTGSRVLEYENLLFWQDASPVPTSTAAQPVVALNGGGNVDISGTVYAPSAQVTMGGGSGGSGGATDVTVQFIAWDMTFSGNSSFAFRYRRNTFAKPIDYGLIQ